ncbi:hypothetical protein NN561_012828 [Cricetulus griseus]
MRTQRTINRTNTTSRQSTKANTVRCSTSRPAPTGGPVDGGSGSGDSVHAAFIAHIAARPAKRGVPTPGSTGMRLRPPCTTTHPFRSRPFAVSCNILPVRAAVPGYAHAQPVCSAAATATRDPTLAVRASGVAESQDRATQICPARAQQTPSPTRRRLPSHSAPPSPLVLDGDGRPAAPLSRDSCAALLWSSQGGGGSGGGCGSPGSAHPTRPWSGGDRGRKERRAPAGPPRLFPWRRGRGREGWRLCWEQCLACDPAPACLLGDRTFPPLVPVETAPAQVPTVPSTSAGCG